ncbi:hypothetical protein BR1R3_23780 [Pseudomonas atacamensis]|nr:hypothetical protein BR1R3_23780 [Pseudomonas atacamensis]
MHSSLTLPTIRHSNAIPCGNEILWGNAIPCGNETPCGEGIYPRWAAQQTQNL